MNTQAACPASAAAPLTDRGSAFDAVVSVLTQAVTTLLDWQDRAAQRRQLSAFGPGTLKDFGIDPADASREASKPRWRR